MEAYRDQYATLFNNGRGVVVLGISLDPDTTLVNWFRELGTPIMVMGDGDKKVATLYQSLNAAGTANQRHLYVIDKTGKFVYTPPSGWGNMGNTDVFKVKVTETTLGKSATTWVTP